MDRFCKEVDRFYKLEKGESLSELGSKTGPILQLSLSNYSLLGNLRWL